MDQQSQKRNRFDQETFDIAKAAADEIFDRVPEVRSIAFIVDFGVEGSNIPTASWHAPEGKLTPDAVAGMMRRVPDLYSQLVGVMMKLTSVIERKSNERRESGSGDGPHCAGNGGGQSGNAGGGGDGPGGHAEG
jgi:hypothetical protein